jgi:hypothetical protein
MYVQCRLLRYFVRATLHSATEPLPNPITPLPKVSFTRTAKLDPIYSVANWLSWELLIPLSRTSQVGQIFAVRVNVCTIWILTFCRQTFWTSTKIVPRTPFLAPIKGLFTREATLGPIFEGQLTLLGTSHLDWSKARGRPKLGAREQGCQIFRDTIYQNGEK